MSKTGEWLTLFGLVSTARIFDAWSELPFCGEDDGVLGAHA